MAAKLTKLTHRIAIQLHVVAESCIIFSSRFRWPVLKLLNTPSYRVITNDVSDYINLLVRIAHIICNHSFIYKYIYIYNRKSIEDIIYKASDGFFPPSGILKKRERNVSITGSVPIFRSKGAYWTLSQTTMFDVCPVIESSTS
jgi:hypothetical protein